MRASIAGISHPPAGAACAKLLGRDCLRFDSSCRRYYRESYYVSITRVAYLRATMQISGILRASKLGWIRESLNCALSHIVLYQYKIVLRWIRKVDKFTVSFVYPHHPRKLWSRKIESDLSYWMASVPSEGMTLVQQNLCPPTSIPHTLFATSIAITWETGESNL